MTRNPAILAATVALAIVAALAAPSGKAAVVTLRVESATAPSPLFDGTVTTLPHAVDGGDGSGPHPCWGPPGASPAATATGALDDALRSSGISWRGNWDPSFGDFFVERIGPFASSPPADYWSLTVNSEFSSGGCLATVVDGDAIRFFYGPLFGTEADPAAGGGAGKTRGPGSQGDPGGAGGEGKSSTGRLRSVAFAAGRYLRRAAEPGEWWARLALSLRAGRSAARAAAGLLEGDLHGQRRDGSLGGDVNATAIAVLALDAGRPRRAARAAAWLSRRQLASGGFGYRAAAAADVDTTALATWALAVAGRRAAAHRGAAFVLGAQETDGGLPAIPGSGSNAQSTGLGLVALRVAGLGPRSAETAEGLTPLDYVAALARRDGSIAYRPGARPTPVWTTAQALLGLTTEAKLMSGYALERDERTANGRENSGRD